MGNKSNINLRKKFEKRSPSLGVSTKRKTNLQNNFGNNVQSDLGELSKTIQPIIMTMSRNTSMDNIKSGKGSRN